MSALVALQLEERQAAGAEAETKAREAKEAREAQTEATAARTRQAEAAYEALQTAIQGVQVCNHPHGLPRWGTCIGQVIVGCLFKVPHDADMLHGHHANACVVLPAMVMVKGRA